MPAGIGITKFPRHARDDVPPRIFLKSLRHFPQRPRREIIIRIDPVEKIPAGQRQPLVDRVALPLVGLRPPMEPRVTLV